MNKSNRTVVDVRMPEEFLGGNYPGSINIPLYEIQERVEEIKLLNQPVILCCASGIRSKQAIIMLKNFGVACEDGGSWMDLN